MYCKNYFLALLLGGISIIPTVAQTTLPTLKWEVSKVKDPQKSSAFMDIGDVTQDGKPDIVLSTLMESGGGLSAPKGALRIFEQTSNKWQEETVIPLSKDLGFINAPQILDINEDGQVDILVQQGFLQTDKGSYQWLEGPNFSTLKPIAPETAADDYFWHETVQIDLDRDGKMDLVTTSANTKELDQGIVKTRLEWYKHLGNGVFEQHVLLDGVGGVFLVNHDVDRDGDEDIILSQFFGWPSLLWVEQVEAPSGSAIGTWKVHPIDGTTGLGYAMQVYDIDADGAVELVYANHNNLNNERLVDADGNKIESGIYWFEFPANPREEEAVWEKHVIQEHYPIDAYDFGNPASQGSPGIFGLGDIDNNGYPDVALPGDGTDNLFILRQKPDHSFVQEVIATGTMFGMARISDLDQDGKPEVVGSMHNAPKSIWDVIFNRRTKGHLKIYKPVITNSLSPVASVSFYPNPVQEDLKIQFTQPLKEEKVIVKILDEQGNTVLQKTIPVQRGETQVSVPVDALKGSRYYINLSVPSVGTITHKLMKK